MKFSPHEILMVADISRETKDTRHRLKEYSDYLETHDLAWYLPDLSKYQDYLEKERNYAPQSVKAHLTTVRNRYAELASDETILTKLSDELLKDQNKIGKVMTFIMKAGSLEINVDLPDSDLHYYPSQAEITNLFNRELNVLQDLRDLLITGLAFGAGLTEQEICTLEVVNLDLSNPERVVIQVPGLIEQDRKLISSYDDLLFVNSWLSAAIKIYLKETYKKDGFVFTGFYKGGSRPRPGSLSISGLQRALDRRLVKLSDGSMRSFTVLDLRRIYARRLFYLGIPIEIIQQNLGHGKRLTTLDYIGPPDPTEFVEPINNTYLINQLEKFERSQYE